MNHNILKIIIDKVVFNQWQQKINQVNQEYHQYFTNYQGDRLILLKMSCDNFNTYYNWRQLHLYHYSNSSYWSIYSHKLIYCYECQHIHPCDNNTGVRIPNIY